MNSGSERLPSADSPSVAPEKKNVFQRIAGVLVAPATTFEDIARRPDALMPLIVILVISLLSTAVVMPRMDFGSIAEQQGEALRKQNPNMTDADIERVERFAVASAKVFGWVSPLIVIVWYVVVAAVLLLAVRLFGGEGNFTQAWAATLYSWMPLVLSGIVTTIVILARGTFDPMTAGTLVKSNPAFLVDPKDQPVLASLLGSFDVFTLWTIVLLVIGFSALSWLSRGKTATIVVSLWIVVIVIKVGFAALGAARA